MERPVFLEPKKTKHTLEIITDQYSVKLSAQVSRVENFQQKHLYSFKFVEIDETNYEQLILILYDRVPCLPERLTKDQLFINIERNLVLRGHRLVYNHNDLPRVLINKPFRALCDDREFYVFMYDFNFMFCELSLPENFSHIQILLGQDGELVIECEHAMTLSQKKNFSIYKITNCHELAQNRQFVDLLLAHRGIQELDQQLFGNLPLTKKIRANIKFQLRQSKARGEQL
jgi:cellulose synthase (UDP-forming)